ncbi:Nucleoporin SEH1 [Psilocybe cubensis]|uniref:Nucleoporin SEH1 n=2 Tax=Psilocybe cubensis TaxID=181762 RepID=A0ACB8GQ01_PSICU|nr:Nucleoporin SEH1 [Psilocybe cubensis]KAH9477447.1 Nucleoporin SEH1 [Psilocybe cubensis]
MIQTGLIQNVHGDLVTDACYDFYGLRLATCSLDQRIKVWQLDENNTWNVEDDWKAHDAAVSKLSWAHPEFGSIIASASFDRTVKIWEQSTAQADAQQSNNVNGSAQIHVPITSRWIERAVLSDAKGTVRAVEFVPHHFGLKLATISTDNMLRIYECVEQPSLVSWQLTEELDVLSIAAGPSPGYLSRAHTMALATPTQTSATLEGASATLVAQALQQSQNAAAGTPNSQARAGLGNREADGGWCLSWCKDKYWGEVIAAGCGTTGVIKIIQINARRSSTLLTLSSSPTTDASTSSSTHVGTTDPTDSRTSSSSASTYAITSVAWAPSCGRSYHLVATGGRDGHVRIWKVKPGSEDIDTENVAMGMSTGESESDDSKWTAVAVADFDQHKSAVGRVEWNITGTILSSAGNDGRIRLWKATSGNVWRPAGSVGVEQTEEPTQPNSKDVDMDA